MRWTLAALTAFLAACPADDTFPGVDGGSDGGDGGDAQVAHGLLVRWGADPTPPGAVSNELSLDAATLHLRNVRAIGDAGVGDPRTLAPRVDLAWSTGVQPADLAFPDAPTGLYSRMSLELDRGDGTYAYELTGTVDLGGDRVPYVVRDTEPLAVSFPYAITVPPGAGALVPVEIKLEDAIEDLDFGSAPIVDGRRTIEPGDPQLARVRSELAAAFDVHSP